MDQAALLYVYIFLLKIRPNTNSNMVLVYFAWKTYMLYLKQRSDIFLVQFSQAKSSESIYKALFWCAPGYRELENIRLSLWFDTRMKNVKSGDDKSAQWGEVALRQGMSFVMIAIWLHSQSPSSTGFSAYRWMIHW